QKLVSTQCVAGTVVPGTRDLPVAIGVEDLSAPTHSSTLRLQFVFRVGKGLVVNLGVDPTNDWTAEFVEVQRLVRIVVELEVMGAVAGFDQLPLLRFGIVERSLASTIR